MEFAPLKWSGSEFTTRLEEARRVPGRNLIYHIGLLCADRRWPTDRARADAAWLAFRKGHCVLTQRRICDHLYEYIAIPIEGGPERNESWPWDGITKYPRAGLTRSD